MSNEKKLIPELRFPEFVKAGEWVGKKLGDLGHFLGGGTPDRSDNSYWIGDIPWISSSDINEDDIHNISTTRFVNNNAIKQSATKIIPKGSVLFVSRVGVGKLAINKEELCTSQDFTSFVPKKDVLNFFIGYYFSSNKNLLQSLNQGTSIKGFSKSDLENFKLPYPKNLKEQQKIASCLSSLDEVIAASSQKLELLKAHKKGLIQNLFPQEGNKVPKYRFPEFMNDGGWEEKTIGDFIESHKGGAALTPSDFETKSEYEVIPKKAIGEGMWLKIENPTYCSEYFYDQNKQSTVDSTYLITTLRDLVPSGPNIGYIVKYKSENIYILAQGVYGLKIKEILFRDFLIHFSNSNRYRKLVNAIMVGSTQVHIRNGEFFKIPLDVPINIKEQQKIASCLSNLEELIAAQADKIEQLKLHKKGLMQGLFPKTIE